MANLKDITEQIEQLLTIESLVQSYQEIAASRMRKTREGVLVSRDFLAGLAQVFIHVKVSYKKQVASVLQKNRAKSEAARAAGPGKTAHVLLSANSGFYGDIVKRTFLLFLENVKKSANGGSASGGGQGEAVIVGKRGLLLFQAEATGIPYRYFDFPDHSVDFALFGRIVSRLAEYERIFVYYGQFKSLVEQEATATSISGDELLSGASQKAGWGAAAVEGKGGHAHYIFEPTIDKLMFFFKTEIFTSIFEQAMYESQLAKFASRMVSLDLAIEQVHKMHKEAEIDRRRAKHRIDNAKQVSLLSGMSLWK